MSTWLRIVFVALMLSSCGGSGTTPSSTSTAIIVATLSPNPLTATDCSPPCQAPDGRLYQWHAQGTLTIQETAGVGGTVNSITVTPATTLTVYTSDYIIRTAGTNRVPAGGTLVIPLGFFYGLADNPSASRSVTLRHTVAFTDDRGNQLTTVATWTLN